MAAIHKTRRERCPRCNEDVDFEINMRYIDYNGIVPCYQCPKCKVESPASSFREFLFTGKVHIYV